MPQHSSQPWSIDQRLALVQKLEQHEREKMRKATQSAWITLGVVASLLTLLVFGIFGALQQLRVLRRDVRTLAAQKSDLDSATRQQRQQLDALNHEIDQKQKALATLIGAVRTDPQTLSGVATALDKNPRSVTLLPRVYVQILDEMDRQWARNLSDRFQNGGVIPVGIEYVQTAGLLRRFEVRYYKKAEEEGANRIVAITKENGVSAEAVYLNLENNTRVRPNHFELWCPPNARASKLKPSPAVS
jgi:hypothetical protein